MGESAWYCSKIIFVAWWLAAFIQSLPEWRRMLRGLIVYFEWQDIYTIKILSIDTMLLKWSWFNILYQRIWLVIQSLLHCAFPINFYGFLSANLLLILFCMFPAAAILKRPRTPPANNPGIDYQTADSEHVLKRPRPFGLSDEVWTEICPSLYISMLSFCLIMIVDAFCFLNLEICFSMPLRCQGW